VGVFQPVIGRISNAAARVSRYLELLVRQWSPSPRLFFFWRGLAPPVVFLRPQPTLSPNTQKNGNFQPRGHLSFFAKECQRSPTVTTATKPQLAPHPFTSGKVVTYLWGTTRPRAPDSSPPRPCRQTLRNAPEDRLNPILRPGTAAKFEPADPEDVSEYHVYYYRDRRSQPQPAPASRPATSKAVSFTFTISTGNT